METSSNGNHLQHTDNPKQQKVYHFLIMGAATIVILAGFRAASVIVAPMLLALFLTIILLVPLRWLESKRCPSLIALLIVIGCTLTIFLGIGLFVGKSLNDFLGKLPDYKDRITQKIDELDQKLEQYGFMLGINKKPEELPPGSEVPSGGDAKDAKPQESGKETAPQGNDKDAKPHKNDQETKLLPVEESPGGNVEKHGLDDADALIANTPEDIEQLFTRPEPEKPLLISLNTNIVMYWVSKSLLELKHLAESGFLVMIITLFMIFEAARFPEKIDRAFGKEGPIRNEHFHHIAAEIRRYLFLKAISSAMSACAATIVYFCFDVPGALLWGSIAFFLYFIPNIGGIIAAIIPAVLIFMTSNIEGLLIYAVCLVAVECTIGYGIEPRMLGHGLGISTVVIILSLFFWGWILGAVGLFLAAPLTIMVKIILQAFKETEWIAILLDDGRTPIQKQG